MSGIGTRCVPREADGEGADICFGVDNARSDLRPDGILHGWRSRFGGLTLPRNRARGRNRRCGGHNVMNGIRSNGCKLGCREIE